MILRIDANRPHAMMKKHKPAAICGVLLAGACALLPLAAVADRPLAVDDAGVNEAGEWDVEAWAARSGRSTTYNLAPTYAPIDGLELGALLLRVPGKAPSLGELQLKWRITPRTEKACYTAATVALARSPGEPGAVNLNGVMTCTREQLGSVHLNLGAYKARGQSAAVTWGIAYERAIAHVTPSIEWFRNEAGKPAVQLGLRGNIARNIQLDGSVGRKDAAAFYTVGTKLQF
jgi:hypothetical protein